MAPFVPEELDVFTVPHSRMKDLVNDYIQMLQATNFASVSEMKLLLDSLSNTFMEFKLHEHIENTLIMKRLKNKLKKLSIRNSLVCNCHKDSHLTDMISLVKEGFDKKTDQDRLNYSLQLKKALDEFTEDFLPHMKQEEEVFQPMLLKYFTYDELCELKQKVIKYHTLRDAAEDAEKGLNEEAEKEESADPCVDFDDEVVVTEDDVNTVRDDCLAPQLNVLDLPPEVTTKIFSFLSPPDLGVAARACPQWRRLALAPALWRELHPARWARGEWDVRMRDVDYAQEEGEWEELEEKEEERYPVIDYDADIDESADSEGDPDQSEYSKKVHREARILLGLVRYVLPSVGEGVNVLNLGHCDAVTNRVLQRLLKLAPNVEYLNLSGTRISDSGLRGLGKNGCGLKLRHVNLSGCQNITDVGLHRIARALRPGDPDQDTVSTGSQSIICWCEQQKLMSESKTNKNGCQREARKNNRAAHSNQQDHTASSHVSAVMHGGNCSSENQTKPQPALNDRALSRSNDWGCSDRDPRISLSSSDEQDGERRGPLASDGNQGEDCHSHCHINASPTEPDPIEDCARPVCSNTGAVPASGMQSPIYSGDPLFSLSPPGREQEAWTDETAECHGRQLFEDEIPGTRPPKPQKLLSYLNLSGCYQITDSGILALAEVGPLLHLHYLDLSGCLLLTAGGLQPLADACPGLNHETFFYCDNIMDGPYPDTASGCQNVDCSRRMCCRKGY